MDANPVMSDCWPDLAIGARTYSFAHLQPFTLNVVINKQTGLTYKLYVSFGCHTFTKKWTSASPIDHQIQNGGEHRCFCTTRHAQSLLLPGFINASVSGKAYFSLRQDYLLIENFPGVTGPYAIFFNLQKARSRQFHAAMFVVSAYEKMELPSKIDKIGDIILDIPSLLM